MQNLIQVRVMINFTNYHNRLDWCSANPRHQTGGFACQWLGNVDMRMIKIYHVGIFPNWPQTGSHIDFSVDPRVMQLLKFTRQFLWINNSTYYGNGQYYMHCKYFWLKENRQWFWTTRVAKVVRSPDQCSEGCEHKKQDISACLRAWQLVWLPASH